MRAVIVQGYKKPAEVVETAAPSLGDRELLIQVEAAGLNQLDEKLRAGEFEAFLKYEAPFVLGHDVAGTVVRVGSAVSEFSTGDLVYARPRDGRIGTFAEQVAVPVEDVALRPRAVTAVEAASLPLVALTAWQALVDVGDVKPGQRVLVHAGAGGVGTVAIQLAKHLGAEVTTTASTKNAELLRSLGADRVVDYRTEQFDQVLAPDFDLVIDGVSADDVLRSLRMVKPGGLVIGLAGPPDPAFARSLGLNPLLRAVMGLLSLKARRLAAARGARYRFLFMRADGEQLAQIAKLVDDGVIRPLVGRTIGLDDIQDALTSIGKDGTVGKTVATLA